MCKTDSWCQLAIKHRKLSSGLCDDLDGGMGGEVAGRSKEEGIYLFI